jgi:hypothetical protein
LVDWELCRELRLRIALVADLQTYCRSLPLLQTQLLDLLLLRWRQRNSKNAGQITSRNGPLSALYLHFVFMRCLHCVCKSLNALKTKRGLLGAEEQVRNL